MDHFSKKNKLSSLKERFKNLSYHKLFPAFLFFWLCNSYANTENRPKPTTLEQFFPFILIGLFFYFILIRPQQKKHKQHGDFLSQLKRGDEVLTASGIYGRIEGLTDSFIILEVAENVRIRIAKSQIASYTGETSQQKKNNLIKK